MSNIPTDPSQGAGVDIPSDGTLGPTRTGYQTARSTIKRSSVRRSSDSWHPHETAAIARVRTFNIKARSDINSSAGHGHGHGSTGTVEALETACEDLLTYAKTQGMSDADRIGYQRRLDELWEPELQPARPSGISDVNGSV